MAGKASGGNEAGLARSQSVGDCWELCQNLVSRGGMSGSITLKLDDGVERVEYNEIVYDDKYDDVAHDPDFRPSESPFELKLNLRRPSYTVEVRSKDNGKIPHFHIFDVDRRFKTCVRIDMPQYFHHGEYIDVLNRRGRDALNKLLQMQLLVDGECVTNWERIVKVWNDNPERLNIGINVAQPNYSLLPSA